MLIVRYVRYPNLYLQQKKLSLQKINTVSKSRFPENNNVFEKRAALCEVTEDFID